MMYFATYNCPGFTDDKIDYINYLLSDIHVLFLQELWLIDNHRYKLNDAFKNCNVFSVSGVHDVSNLHGRPYGGCAIIVKKTVRCKLTCVSTISKRIVCILLTFGDICIMLCSMYMPCDSYTSIDVEYDEEFCELHALQLKHNPMYVIFGGDLNTDLSRDMSRHTKSLIQYCIDDDIICSGTIHVSIRKLYSYCSRINQSTSFLDHFLFSRELLKHVVKFSIIDDM